MSWALRSLPTQTSVAFCVLLGFCGIILSVWRYPVHVLLDLRAQPATYVRGTCPSAAAHHCVKGIPATLWAEFYLKNSAAQVSKTPLIHPGLRPKATLRKEGPMWVTGTAAPSIVGNRQELAVLTFPSQCVTDTFPNLLLSPRARLSPWCQQKTSRKSHFLSEEGFRNGGTKPHLCLARSIRVPALIPWANISNSALLILLKRHCCNHFTCLLKKKKIEKTVVIYLIWGTICTQVAGDCPQWK